MKVLYVALLVTLLAYTNAGEYTNRFLELYNLITASSSGYYSKEGIPYHSVETMMVESVDYGHETDSEALSYNIWLKAMYGAIAGDFEPFNQAWDTIENHLIPQTQHAVEKYSPQNPGTSSGVTVGVDPIFNELKSSYGDSAIRVMHWLLDVDNIYGFGNIQGECELGPSASGPSFVNNGAGSVYQGITYPTCDSFKYGGPTGFSWYSSEPSWQYSAAPDADARAISAAYWASQWAAQQGKSSQIQSTLSKAAKLGDYLRYTFFDKHFKKIGNCIGGSVCPAGTGKDSAHYLISWYIGWGGTVSDYGYTWRMCSGEAHIGYQNPITAYALINEPSLRPKGATAVEDWQNSLQRQLEFYKWVQTSEGPLGGGVTNSWNSNYDDPPASVKANTFHGMFYEQQPGYDGSSNWFGMQTWTVDRLAQYYYITGDATAKEVLDKWISWILTKIQVNGNYYSVPVTLTWSGNTPSDAHAQVTGQGDMIGMASSIARALSYYAAKSGNSQAKQVAKQLLDAMWASKRDSIGLSVTSSVYTLSGFKTKVYIPIQGWSGTYPNGDKINSTSTFLDIRSWYRNDPNFSQLQNYLNGGSVPKINYHRFWEQADMALALGAYGMLFNE